MRERSDRLRRRPNKIRYFFLAVSHTALHVGMSYGGLQYANTNRGLTNLYIADLATLKVIEIKEPIPEFMERWSMHYNEPTWDYAREMEELSPEKASEED